MEYQEYNDYELLNYVYENIEEANNIVIDKYMPLINSISMKLYKYANNCGLELNDLIQEGMIGLTYAINSFCDQKNVMFYTYAKKCIERKIISALISAQRQKHKILNESLSYDIITESTNNILKDDLSDPLAIILSSDEKKQLKDKIKKKLTQREKEVFELMITGFNYKEIADILGKDLKAIDNAIQRVRSKARDILNSQI